MKVNSINIKRLVSLLTPDLDIYTVVHMARKDITNNKIHCAMLRLKTDQDKLRYHSIELSDMIDDYFSNFKKK